MKKLSFSLLFLLSLLFSCDTPSSESAEVLKADTETKKSDNAADQEAVKKACLDYIECFYEADTTKAYRSVHPKLQKRGYGYRDGQYSKQYEMNFEQLIKLAKNWNDDGSKTNADSPKKVEIYEVLDKTASAKVYAEWGIDYVHLSKLDGKWYVMNVLWQSNQPQN